MFRIMVLGDSVRHFQLTDTYMHLPTQMLTRFFQFTQDVGKSSVSVAFASGEVPGHLPSTVGVDIVMKDIVIDQKRVRLQMFDPAGHVRLPIWLDVLHLKIPH